MALISDQNMNIETQPISLQLHDEKNFITTSESRKEFVDGVVDAYSTPPRTGSTFSFKNSSIRQRVLKIWTVVVGFGRFMGPGAIISVAYIDPDNYQTAISAGDLQYKLLFMILVSNIIAIYLQVRLK
jgi:metal iron transporter